MFDNKQVIGSTSSTSQNLNIEQILTVQLFEDWSNALKLGSKRGMIKVLLALLMIRET